MTALVLTQPMLLPWRGMFEQIKLADRLVYHDDIQLPKAHGKAKSFQTRVQVKTAGGWEWLSLPVDTHAGDLICDARLADQSFRKRHLDQLRKSYTRAPFFGEVFETLILPIYRYETQWVAELTMHSMNECMRFLAIDRPTERTTEMKLPRALAGSARVLEVCTRRGADRYVTGLGARQYIDYDLFERAGVAIEYMQYDLSPYPQLHGAFNPYVSIVDLLFSVGPSAGEHLTSRAIYWRQTDVSVPDRAVK
jgi:hypothetical protein